MHRQELLFWEPEPLDKTVSEKKILQFLLIVQGSVFGHWFGHTVRRRFRDGAGPRDPAGSLFLMILYIKLTSIGGILLVCLSLPISSISRATLSLCAERLSMSSSYCLLVVYFNQSRSRRPGFPKSLFPSLDSCFYVRSELTNHEGHGRKQGRSQRL